jgi:hypothetical protein
MEPKFNVYEFVLQDSYVFDRMHNAQNNKHPVAFFTRMLIVARSTEEALELGLQKMDPFEMSWTSSKATINLLYHG